MRFEGPIYRPPSEADSLLIQATVGCPHNRCTFCMVYKRGPKYRARPVGEVCGEIEEAGRTYGRGVRSLFFPAGNTIAMPTDDLAAICHFAEGVFPHLERITVYGSSPYVARKGAAGLKALREAGLRRIHVGLESGDDLILKRVKKGTTATEQIEAGRMVREAGIELSEYVILGLGGRERTDAHARKTAEAINAIEPDFVRLRTLVPKIHTPLLREIQKGEFCLLTPHEVLRETRSLVQNITCRTILTSDHYTNYLNLTGRLPEETARLLDEIDAALSWDESRFRPHFVGEQ